MWREGSLGGGRLVAVGAVVPDALKALDTPPIHGFTILHMYVVPESPLAAEMLEILLHVVC